jgi:hypothetical protein
MDRTAIDDNDENHDDENHDDHNYDVAARDGGWKKGNDDGKNR